MKQLELAREQLIAAALYAADETNSRGSMRRIREAAKAHRAACAEKAKALRVFVQKDGDGFKITWKKTKDGFRVDHQSAFHELFASLRDETQRKLAQTILNKHTHAKAGSRRFLPTGELFKGEKRKKANA